MTWLRVGHVTTRLLYSLFSFRLDRSTPCFCHGTIQPIKLYGRFLDLPAGKVVIMFGISTWVLPPIIKYLLVALLMIHCLCSTIISLILLSRTPAPRPTKIFVIVLRLVFSTLQVFMALILLQR